MDLITYTTDWVKGEVTQGRIMIAIGVPLLIAGIYILKSQNDILRGTIIPLGLILLILFGYGGFQAFSRTSHLSKVTELSSINNQKAIEMEIEKASKDDKTYKMLKPIWGGLIVLSVVLFYFFSNTYFKGLAIGLIFMFSTALTLDTFLHHRLSIYLGQLLKILET